MVDEESALLCESEAEGGVCPSADVSIVDVSVHNAQLMQACEVMQCSVECGIECSQRVCRERRLHCVEGVPEVVLIQSAVLHIDTEWECVEIRTGDGIIQGKLVSDELFFGIFVSVIEHTEE